MKNNFATLPPAAMWVLAAFLGLPALYDGAVALAAGRALDAFIQIGAIMMAGFLAWCAFQRRTGHVTLLATPRVTLIGYICFGAFVGCFLFKIAARHTSLLG